MAQVEDIKVLNIDEVAYDVDKMSDTVKEMVNIFNKWNQKEADVTEEMNEAVADYQDQIMLLRAGKNDISRGIILQVRKELEEAENTEEGSEGENVETPDDSATDPDVTVQ